MNKFIILCTAILGLANVYAFDGIVGETFKGVGYVLFGDSAYERCHNSHTTVVVGNSPYVTQLYRSGYNNYYSRPQLVVQVPEPQPVQQVVVQQQQVVEQYPVVTRTVEQKPAVPVYYQNNVRQSATYVEPQPEKVSVTQVSQPTRVWVPARYENRTTAEGITIRVKVEGHYVTTY